MNQIEAFTFYIQWLTGLDATRTVEIGQIEMLHYGLGIMLPAFACERAGLPIPPAWLPPGYEVMKWDEGETMILNMRPLSPAYDLTLSDADRERLALRDFDIDPDAGESTFYDADCPACLRDRPHTLAEHEQALARVHAASAPDEPSQDD